ncbi:hypothetical protein KKD19_02200 [Patescibacteria group bacterium]|nr:hypothetical protein [Patescibacteria group bacterium]MBU4512037.1 hypothetical protein [Patescibacteria group bacterium]MCG2693186.1 hypothetical protein [Candidatus Parcubacteria bacterium]
MSIKNYLSLMFLATVICWVAFGMVLNYIDPQEAGFVGFALFYISLLFSLTGLLSLVGLVFRSRFSNAPVFQRVHASFRQAIWFSGLVVFLLFLQGLKVLEWWNIVLFVLFLALLEFFFISHRKVSSRPSEE